MKKLSAILALALVFALTVVPVSAAQSIEVSLVPSATTVPAGETFTLDVVYTPSTVQMATANIKLEFDPELVSYVSAAAPSEVVGAQFIPNATNVATGILLLPCSAGASYYGGKMGTLTFKALESVNGTAQFTLTENGAMEDFDLEMVNATFKNLSVTIGEGGSEPDPDPVFTVTAVDDGTKTTVTVANKGDKVGKVYVASYNGEVLTKCEAKDLADGSLEFAVTGSVKVFVWDANNVPLLDNYVVATAPVQ